MKTRYFLTMALFAVLLASTWGIGFALDGWQDSANQEAGTSVYTDDAIGTGSMPDSHIDETPAVPSDPGTNESLGTGSMDASPSDDPGFFSPLGVDIRSGYDGN